MIKMKKLVLTIAIVLGVTFGATAQESLLFFEEMQQFTTNEDFLGGSLLGDGLETPGLPGDHGGFGDVDAPLGSGALLLIGLGAAYAVRKRKNK